MLPLELVFCFTDWLRGSSGAPASLLEQDGHHYKPHHSHSPLSWIYLSYHTAAQGFSELNAVDVPYSKAVVETHLCVMDKLNAHSF